MTIDTICILAVGLAAVVGAFQGALAHVAQLGAAVAGWLGARWLAPTVAPLLQNKVPAFAAHPVAAVVTFVGCALVANVVLRGVAKRVDARHGAVQGIDRGLGALLGGAHAALALWVILSALALWGRPIHIGQLSLDPKHSELAGLAAEYSALRALSAAAGSVDL